MRPERQPQVTNCVKNHSAAYNLKGCQKFKETKNTLQIAAINRLSYRDALVYIRNSNKCDEMIQAHVEHLANEEPSEELEVRLRHTQVY